MEEVSKSSRVGSRTDYPVTLIKFGKDTRVSKETDDNYFVLKLVIGEN